MPNCEKCGCGISEPNAICPQCGSRVICLDETISLDELAGDGIQIKGKSASYKSKSKKHPYYFTMFLRKEQNRKLGEIVVRSKSEDRLADKYKEKIVTLDGRTIHDVDASLSEHLGHGTARQRHDGE